MPSSEVRYQRGDVYRPFDEDILRARRSSSSTTGSSSVLSATKRGGQARSRHSGISAEIHRSPLQARCSPEEYLTKKKVEVKTTKNTERRVQRCIVLEDGRIIEHDDPHIVVDTIEDTQTHEFDHLEDKAVARELQASMKESYRRAGITDASAAGSSRREKRHRRKSLHHDHQQSHHQERSKTNKNTTDMISGNNVVRHSTEDTTDGSIVNDTFKRIVNTHDVKENLVRTHAAKDLGMISQKGLRKVLKKQGKVSDYIKYHDSDKTGTKDPRGDPNNRVHQYQTESHKRIVDTQDVHDISRRLKNGQIRSETFRTEKHEVFDDKKAPDDSAKGSGSSETEHERDEQKFRMTKIRDFTDYYDGKGNLLINGPNLTSHDVKVDGAANEVRQRWTEVGEDRIKQTRRSLKKKLRPDEDAERTDALTKKPLDLNREERARKKETNKWLDRHFGSDWSLHESSSNHFKYLDKKFDPAAATPGNNANVRRTMSFSSIPINYTNPGEKASRVIKQTTTTIRPGFDKHVVSSIIKSIPAGQQQKQQQQQQQQEQHHQQEHYHQQEFRRNKSLEHAANRPYHSSLTLATDGRPLLQNKGHSASTTSLLNETSQLTFRKVPIERHESPQPRLRPRVEQERSTARSINNRRSYYYGEDPNRVQSEPPRRVHRSKHNQSANVPAAVNNKNTSNRMSMPLYRTELLKTSNRMHTHHTATAEDTESIVSRGKWRDELSRPELSRPEFSKSYHDISAVSGGISKKQREAQLNKLDMTQSYSELPTKPSQLFGWSDAFQLHGYGHARASERTEGVRTHNLQRSKSFATPSDHYSSTGSEASYNILSGHRSHGHKSYKNTKVSSPPDDRLREGGGGGGGEHGGGQVQAGGLHHHKQQVQKSTKKEHTSGGNGKTLLQHQDAVYEFERKIPMQSSILEAQKFKTVIFVSGN